MQWQKKQPVYTSQATVGIWMPTKVGLCLNLELPLLKKYLSDFYLGQLVETNVLFSAWTTVKTYKYILFNMLFIFEISCPESRRTCLSYLHCICQCIWIFPWGLKCIIIGFLLFSYASTYFLPYNKLIEKSYSEWFF